VTPQGLLSVRTAYPDLVELRTPDDHLLVSLEAMIKDTSTRSSSRVLDEMSLVRLLDGWLTAWTSVGEPRLLRRLNADGTERWRFLMRDDASNALPPP